MKIRTRQFIQLLYFEKECIEFLEEQARNGFELSHIGFLFTHFKPCQKPLKYQIDYHNTSEEYWSIVKDYGYIHIDTYEEIHIFSNEDLNAPDLQNDYEVYQQILLERYPKKNIIIGLLIGLLSFFLGCYYFINFAPYILGNFYLHYASLFSYILFWIVGGVLFNEGLLSYFKRKSIHHNTYTFSMWHKYDLWSQNISLVLFACFILLLILIDMKITKFIVLLTLFSFIIITVFRLMTRSKQNFEKRNKLFQALVTFFTVFLAIVLTLSINQSPSLQEDIPYSQYNTPFIKESSYFVNSLIGIPNSFIQGDEIIDIRSSLYHECRDENIAREVLKFEIIETERLMRMTSDELYQAIESHSPLILNAKETKALSYSNALTKYRKIYSQIVDDCYIFNNFAVVRYKDIVIRIYIDNMNNIDKTLKQYFHVKI